jgi:hypothetical protein
MRTGLYVSPQQLDGRTWVAKTLKRIRERLLEDFPSPPSARVQIIADLVSVKIFQVNCYKAQLLSGNTDPSADQEYQCLCLMNSITRDIVALDQMAKNHAPKDRTPSLQQYVEAIKNGEIIV